MVECAGNSIRAVCVVGCELAAKLGIAGVISTANPIITVGVRGGECTSSVSAWSVGWVTEIQRTGNPIVADIVVYVVLTALTREAEVFRAILTVITIGMLWCVSTAGKAPASAADAF